MCGKATVVPSGGREICAACREEEQQLYISARTLIRERVHGSLTIQDVAEILRVDERKISHLVKSGYFQLVKKSLQLPG
jgi:hypothetical protein